MTKARHGGDAGQAREAQAQALVSEGDEALALATLRQVMRSSRTPGAARAQAARSVLEVCGRLGRHATAQARGDAPAAELSVSALDARIAKLEAQAQGGAGAGRGTKSAGAPRAWGARLKRRAKRAKRVAAPQGHARRVASAAQRGQQTPVS